MIVVDTNILLYFSLEPSDPSLAAKARQLLEAEPRWILPGLWRHEFLNALCNYLRSGALTSDKAWEHYAKALFLFRDQEAPVDLNRALDLSHQFNITGSDAQFVALAESADTVLVTQDKRLLRAVGDRARSIDQYLAR
jgi:predicted nucleic acid-binding protein